MFKIILTGNATRDPEIRANKQGETFVTLSIAVNYGTKASPKVEFVDLSANNKIGDVIHNFVKKGDKILVEGLPSINTYVNKENNPVSKFRVYVGVVELLSSKYKDESDSNDKSPYELPEIPEKMSNDLTSDVPF